MIRRLQFSAPQIMAEHRTLGFRKSQGSVMESPLTVSYMM